MVNRQFEKWLYTSFAQPRRPRSRLPFAERFRSHSRTGMLKPVLGRERIALGKGRRGASSIALLPGGYLFPSHLPTERRSSMSTRGTRISSECAIPAQSESRRSWLRMYQQDSRQETVERAEAICVISSS